MAKMYYDKDADLNIIKDQLGELKEYKLCGAWGDNITIRDYLWTCLEDIQGKIGIDSWHSIGKTNVLGHPSHPLYLKADRTLDDFNMNDYLNKS